MWSSAEERQEEKQENGKNSQDGGERKKNRVERERDRERERERERREREEGFCCRSQESGRRLSVCSARRRPARHQTAAGRFTCSTAATSQGTRRRSLTLKPPSVNEPGEFVWGAVAGNSCSELGQHICSVAALSGGDY
ncbi:unnamed protein product [Pleuronectes platessa]|uniref:Uncharacterized protein n=1 Tax=Pleuronectes platessa TaxID=8262 RepID=A0A9N7Z5U3_PLEPL|nr:unnamed protein product [Pleuronectes platessa]